MSNRLLRLAAASAAVVTPLVAFAGTASAHASNASANCSGITVNLTNFENAAGDRVYTSIDGTLVDTFNGPFVTTTHTVPVPQDGAAHSWTVVVDSVSGTGGTQYDATYTGAVGPCGEVITTTTAVTTTTEQPTTTTELVTTTTEQETTTSLLDTTTTEAVTTTTVPVDTSTTEPVGTLPTTSSLPSTTSSSVATTSTTSVPPSSPTTAPTSSSAPPAPSSTTPECVDNPNTPTDDCAPICTPVTQPDGTNSCGPSLPATGSNTAAIVIAAWIAILAGIVALGYGAAHRDQR